MSPKELSSEKIIIDLSLLNDEFHVYNDFLEDVLNSRLRKRFQTIKRNQLVLESNEQILRNLGLDYFTSKACMNYVTHKCSQEDNHLDIIDWVVLYMQDLICHRRRFLDNVFGRFPYQESNENTWFKHESQQEEEFCKQVNVLNRIEKRQQQNEPYPLLDGKRFPEEMDEEGYTLFYHGTDHKSAVSILEDGIDLQKGKPNKDFSHGKGFYLNNNYKDAKSWAFKIRTTERAVLIFKIPKDILDQFRENSINLFGKQTEWNRITENFRRNPSKRFMKEMKRISFIEGPIASVRCKGSVKIKGPLEKSYQMCLHSDNLAEEFDLNLHSIIFFN